MKLVECVPNFSEGRKVEVVDEIVNDIKGTEGVYLLGRESDSDHNRSVITFAGDPEDVKKAAFRGIKRAAELIDLTKHEGRHPRMGATDVVPFVPLQGSSMEDCINLAKDLGRQVGEELEIPVFLYEYAASRPERRNLANVRKGEFEGLRDLIGKDSECDPDFGPKKIHPRAGATAIGARKFLIAFNVNLKSNNLAAAKSIAKKIRESSGGLPKVKAIGLELEEKGIVQVSMNLVDFEVTSPWKAYQEIEKEAQGYGIEILESELIGLAPRDTFADSSPEALKIKDFTPDMIIEERIKGLMGE